MKEWIFVKHSGNIKELINIVRIALLIHSPEAAVNLETPGINMHLFK